MTRDLKASGLLSIVIMGSRLLGLVREVAFASLFGAGAIGDAFQIAFRVPNLLRDLLAEGALSSALVPTLTEALEKDGVDEAYRLGNMVLGVLMVVTGALSLLGIVFAESIVHWIAAGFAGDLAKLALATRLTQLMMPILMLVSLGAVWMGMLNARRHFTIPALAPALFNVVSIATAAVVWWLGRGPEASIVVWAGGTLLAGVAQAGVQAVALARLGYRPYPRLRGAWHHPGIRRIAMLMAPAVLGVAAVQINVIVNSRFAANLGDGPLSQLAYAFRLFYLPLGMFGVALSTVTMTSVSEAAAKANPADMARRCADSLAAGWMLTSASAVGLWILAEPVVTLIYRYGATSSGDAALIAACLRAYVLGLVPYSLVKILAPSYYGIDRPRIPLVASVAGVAVNITFNTLTYRTLGAPGIAMGTALGAVTNVSVLRALYGSVVAPLPSTHLGSRVAGLVVANVVLAAVAYGGWHLVGLGLSTLGLPGFGRRLVLAGGMAIIITGAFAAYVMVLRAWRYPGAALLASMPMRLASKLRRKRSNESDPAYKVHRESSPEDDGSAGD